MLKPSLPSELRKSWSIEVERSTTAGYNGYVRKGTNRHLNRGTLSFQQKNALQRLQDAFNLEEKTEDISPREFVKEALKQESLYTRINKRLFGDGIDPYVVIKLCREDNATNRSRDVFEHSTKAVMRGGSNVILAFKDFNIASHVFRDPIIPDEELVLKVICWDKDHVSADDLIGMGKISVTEVLGLTRPKKFIVDIEMREGQIVEKTGRIEMEISFNPVHQKLIVEVVALCELHMPKRSEYDENLDDAGVGGPLSIIVIYLGTGLVYYAYVENWGIIETLYFSFICMTTVGYGDQKRFISSWSYYFTSFFVLSGFSFAAMSISMLVRYVVDHMSDDVGSGVFGDEEDDNCNEDEDPDDEEEIRLDEINPFVCIIDLLADIPRSIYVVLLIIAINIVGAMFTEAILPPGEESPRKLRSAEALYFVVVTLTTVGFGDFAPGTPIYRIWASIWIVVGTIALAKMMGDIMDYSTAKKNKKKQLHILKTAFRNKKDFLSFDEDGDGEISELEFLVKMLSRLKLCRDADVKEIRDMFKEMDESGDGTIDLEELSEYMLKKEKSMDCKSPG